MSRAGDRLLLTMSLLDAEDVEDVEDVEITAPHLTQHIQTDCAERDAVSPLWVRQP
jgi:hypothetical protein